MVCLPSRQGYAHSWPRFACAVCHLSIIYPAAHRHNHSSVQLKTAEHSIYLHHVERDPVGAFRRRLVLCRSRNGSAATVESTSSSLICKCNFCESESSDASNATEENDEESYGCDCPNVFVQFAIVPGRCAANLQDAGLQRADDLPTAVSLHTLPLCCQLIQVAPRENHRRSVIPVTFNVLKITIIISASPAPPPAQPTQPHPFSPPPPQSVPP